MYLVSLLASSFSISLAVKYAVRGETKVFLESLYFFSRFSAFERYSDSLTLVPFSQ